ncbi:MAG: family 16 glycosylhydrolase [Acetatifactor sp.]|nr:family 16 glycosylhydrolase [Acetatifactor sp.]
MKKKVQVRGILAGILALTLLTGCGATAPAEEAPVEGESSFQPKVGTKVPAAFQNQDEEETVNVKAKNFKYDESNMDYRLVWSDEFDYEGMPDESKWGFEQGGNGWGNHELQCYNKENATVKDGKLFIELRKEKKGNSDYTSARMITRGKRDWLYGKFEICAKLPAGLGTWPAIWMMPSKDTYGNWPNSGEIDICEHVGYDQGVIHSTIHTGAYNHMKNTQKYNTVKVEDCSEAFHVYGVEWLPDKLIFSVDGEEIFTYKPTDYLENPTAAEWPYDQKMYLILNLAFGGDWGGSKGIDESLESAQMEVDYVRVYQSPQVSYIEREDKEVENPFLKAAGKVLRNNAGTGDVVQLKGTNAGGYLLQEFWMTVTNNSSNVAAEIDIYRVLTERFGAEKAMELINLYQDNYFTEADFDYCKEIGMNCIRLPMWYRNLVDENGEFYDNCFERVDWFVEQAAKRNMYVILDMHGAPGSQNGSDHSGKDGGDHKQDASEFFFGDEATVKANQELYYKIWEAIAEHYKGNEWVAGYDLLNEPYCTYRYNTSQGDKVLHEILWNVYDEAYKKIRAIDPDHVIIMEATWDPVDLPNPDNYGWENVMYEYHNYLYDDYDNKAGKQVPNMVKKLNAIKSANYNVPSYMGEFALFNNLEAWDEGVKAINESGVSWTTWTYKVISDYGNWGIKNQKNWQVNVETNDYDVIANAWSQVGDAKENTGLAEVLTRYYKMIDLEAK